MSAEIPEKSIKNLCFRRDQLSYLLRSFRQLNEKTRKDIESELSKSPYKDAPEWENIRKLVGGSLIGLESPGKANETIELPSTAPLAETYGIGELMFESLLSEPLDKKIDYVAYNYSNTEDFLEPPEYGKGKLYQIPRRVLSGSDDIKIIYQKLKPATELTETASVEHDHSGEELIFLENGCIEFCLKNLGLRTILNKGQFIHFDSSQSHIAYNKSNTESAEMLIFRLLRFRSMTSTDVFKKIRSLKSSAEIMKKMFKEIVEPQWKANIEEITDKDEIAKDKNLCNEIHDRAGLARFLSLLWSKPFAEEKLTFNELLKKAKGKSVKLNRSKLVRLHYGITSISEKELSDLARIYEIEPTLFYNYLSPAFMYAIAVDTEEEMKSLPSTFNTKQGMTYKIPYRRLAFSDIAIALVTMEPGLNSLENKHPGYELLKPLEGEIVINIGNQSHPPIKQGEFAFFRSHILHTVSNKGEKPAKVLVIRFLE